MISNYLSNADLIKFFCTFSNHTLSRRLLSFVPMARAITRNEHLLNLSRIGGFGSGSCFMEIALWYLFQSEVFMHDAKLSANKAVQDLIQSSRMLNLDISPIENLYNTDFSFGLNVSIQTLEHIKDWEAALYLICKSVSNVPQGAIYVDVPYFNNNASIKLGTDWLDKESKRQWEKHQHFHCGFTLEQLTDKIVESGLRIIEVGMSAFKDYDLKLHKRILNDPIEKYVTFETACAMLKEYDALCQEAQNVFSIDTLNITDAANKKHSAIYVLAQK